MYLRQLALTDFRSYANVRLTLTPGVSVLVGPNGQGKTNLVEAAHYLATLGSHRVATDAPLVRSGATRAIVHGVVVNGSDPARELAVDLEINPGKANRARLNAASVPRPRDIVGVLRAVIFAPEDIGIVRGEPTQRRRFIDDILIARNPRFSGIRSDYERVLKQRNALLKTVGLSRRAGRTADLRTLEAWDGHLASYGAQLLRGRLKLVKAFAPLLQAAYRSVSAEETPVSISYQSSLDDADVDPVTDGGLGDGDILKARMLAALAAIRPREVERGVTLVGPHRDDLTVTLGELPAKGYASHGECWSTALALRLASYELLRVDGEEPVLILDDVFAELDTNRREHLAKLVSGATQLLITAAVAADVPDTLDGARFDVAAGEVNRVR